MTEGNT